MYEHNTWNYVYLLAHLLSKPRTEMTGVEDYLLDRVVASELSFFPLHRALSLQHRRDESDSDTSDDDETSDSSSDDSVAGVTMPTAPQAARGNPDINVQVISTPRRRPSGSRPWSSANRRRSDTTGDDSSGRRRSGADEASLVQQQVEAMQQLATRVEEALRTLQGRADVGADAASTPAPTPTASSGTASLVSEAARIIARRTRGRRRSRGEPSRHRQRRVPSFRLAGREANKGGNAHLL